MNNLSWLIYLADVTGSLNNAIGFTAAAVGASAGSAIVAGTLMCAEGNADAGKAIHAKLTRLWWVMPVLLLLLVIAPSRDTVYAIAASEMGEEIVQSETAGKAMQALDAWLDRQIEGGE